MESCDLQMTALGIHPQENRWIRHGLHQRVLHRSILLRFSPSTSVVA